MHTRAKIRQARLLERLAASHRRHADACCAALVDAGHAQRRAVRALDDATASLHAIERHAQPAPGERLDPVRLLSIRRLWAEHLERRNTLATERGQADAALATARTSVEQASRRVEAYTARASRVRHRLRARQVAALADQDWEDFSARRRPGGWS